MDASYGVYAALSMTPFTGTAVDKIGMLMQQIYAPIFQIARERGLPIIDMAKSFDLNNERLYISQIEPSEIGSKIISDTITYAVKNHNSTEGSHFYF